MEKKIRIVNEYGAFSAVELNMEYVKCKKTLAGYADIIDEQQKQISKLESELEHSKEYTKSLRGMLGLRSAKENIKLANKLYGLNFEVPDEEEPLPFSDEEYEEKTKTELPTMPIDVASMLINARNGLRDKYSKDDLKEIIEHLRAFIDNPSDD